MTEVPFEGVLAKREIEQKGVKHKVLINATSSSKWRKLKRRHKVKLPKMRKDLGFVRVNGRPDTDNHKRLIREGNTDKGDIDEKETEEGFRECKALENDKKKEKLTKSKCSRKEDTLI